MTYEQQNNISQLDLRPTIPNGAAAAALLSSTVGCLVIGILTVAAVMSPGISKFLNFYGPAGPLTGQTTIGVVVWLIFWAVLHRQWKNIDVNLGRVFLWACITLAIALLLTFPPVFELFASH